jgi:cell division protein FtsQ
MKVRLKMVLSSKLFASAIMLLLVVLAVLFFYNSHWALQKIELNNELKYQSERELNERLAPWVGLDLLHESIFSIKEDVQSLPWVASAAVEVQWPGVVKLNIIEHTPVASWNETLLISDQGKVFGPVEGGEHLPRLSGPEHSKDDIVKWYLWFHQQFSLHGNALIAVKMSERGGWVLTLESGLNIKLGNKALQQRTKRVKTMLNVLASQLNDINYFDARYSNGVAVGKNNETNNIRLEGEMNE